MKVKEIMDITNLDDVIVEIHFKKIENMYGHDMVVNYTKTSVYDDLSKYYNNDIKHAHSFNRVAPIYQVLKTIHGGEIKQQWTIQLYI